MDFEQVPSINQKYDIREQSFSLFGKGNNLQGNFKLQGQIRVASYIKGDIQIEDGVLIIERDGVIEGRIECHKLINQGKIIGDIQSKGQVILKPASHTQGNISSENLTIYPGAYAEISAETL